MAIKGKVYVPTLQDLQSSGVAIQVLPKNRKRKRAIFVTDGVVFIKPGNGDDMLSTGYAVGVASAYGGGLVVTTTDAVYAARYGTATLRVFEESN